MLAPREGAIGPFLLQLQNPKYLLDWTRLQPHMVYSIQISSCPRMTTFELARLDAAWLVANAWAAPDNSESPFSNIENN